MSVTGGRFFSAVIIFVVVVWTAVVLAADRYYSIQVSAYKTAEGAATDIKKYQAKGLVSFSRHEPVGDKGMWYRVYIGKYPSKQEATAKAEKLKADGVFTWYSVKALGLAEVSKPSDSVSSPSPEEVRQSGPRQPVSKAATPAPAAAAAVTTELTNAPAGWEIIVDLSGSTSDDFRCNGYSKFEAIFSLLKRVNPMIPDYPYQAALRKFAYKRALTRNDYTRLVWGVKPYDRQAFSLAIDDLGPTDAGTPLGWAILAADQELAQISGRKALIIFSDFKENYDFGEPLTRIRDFKAKYSSDIYVYTVYVGKDDKDIQLAHDLARTSGGGQAYDGCRLLSDPQYLENTVREIFGVPVTRAVVAQPCKDSDGDGVCDDKDKCPRTPKGAPVDERGCWIAAYAQYFDFDKAEVKKAYIPKLKAAADIIEANPGIPKIVITGHTDYKGTDKYNQKLGLKRAEAIRDILVKEGVPKNRLEVRSYGKSKPVADNKTEAGRAKNRRVEFHVGDPEAY